MNFKFNNGVKRLDKPIYCLVIETEFAMNKTEVNEPAIETETEFVINKTLIASKIFLNLLLYTIIIKYKHF